MIAIGGAIGTGLFLGSALAVRTAGPGVILSYLLAAGIALLLMGCLSEMAVAHPTAGSFGIYAELYLSHWAGFVVRYTYWAAQSIAIGGEAVAAAIYTRWWFPHTPAWAWVIFYSAMLIFVNARSVGAFGEFEYWFSIIKVSAIVVFIVLGAAILFGVHQQRPIGLENFRAHGGFLPRGWLGVWLALAFVIFGFIGTETVAVTAGEAKDPDKSVPRAMRSMLARLIIFYVGAIAILVGVIPWNQIQPGQGITVSPFVRVFEVMHIPAAAHIINFVVLTAALSSMNCNLYVATRMIFSLSRGGYAPEVLGRVSKKGTPACRASVLRRWFGCRDTVRHLVSQFRLRVHVRYLPVRRPVCVDDDLRHPSKLSQTLASAAWPPLPVEMPLFPYPHHHRRPGGAGNLDLHLVGRGDAGYAGVGNTVAAADKRALLHHRPPAGESGRFAIGEGSRRARGGGRSGGSGGSTSPKLKRFRSFLP